MRAELAIAMLSGAAVYAWLSLVVPPFTRAARVAAHSLHGGGWPWALPLVICQNILVTAIPAAVFFLTITQGPAAAVYLVEGPAVRVGAATAMLLWCGRTLVAGAPRLPRDAELALALAVASFRTDEAAELSRIERRYGEWVYPSGPERAGSDGHALSSVPYTGVAGR